MRGISISIPCYFYKPTLVNENSEIEGCWRRLMVMLCVRNLFCVMTSYKILMGLNEPIIIFVHTPRLTGLLFKSYCNREAP